MNIKNEIDAFKEFFKEGGVFTKIFLVLGFFLSFSSLTSISSAIIGWKGFILEGIIFYHSHVVAPIISTANVFGFGYSKPEIHAAILLSISVTVGMRLLCLGQISAFQEINRRYGGNAEPNLSYYWFVSIAYPVGVWTWYGISDSLINPWLIASVCLGYPAFIVAPKYIMSKFGFEQYEQNSFSYFKSYYMYIGLFLLILGALAAINSGINEEVVKPETLSVLSSIKF